MSCDMRASAKEGLETGGMYWNMRGGGGGGIKRDGN